MQLMGGALRLQHNEIFGLHVAGQILKCKSARPIRQCKLELARSKKEREHLIVATPQIHNLLPSL